MALNRYNDGSWDTLYLDTSYPSATASGTWRTTTPAGDGNRASLRPDGTGGADRESAEVPDHTAGDFRVALSLDPWMAGGRCSRIRSYPLAGMLLARGKPPRPVRGTARFVRGGSTTATPANAPGACPTWA